MNLRTLEALLPFQHLNAMFFSNYFNETISSYFICSLLINVCLKRSVSVPLMCTSSFNVSYRKLFSLVRYMSFPGACHMQKASIVILDLCIFSLTPFYSFKMDVLWASVADWILSVQILTLKSKFPIKPYLRIWDLSRN